MTKEQLAKQLNGNEIGKEISSELKREAKKAGLVVVFGASDDLMEFVGAIDDEQGVYDGGEAFIVDGKLWQGIECDHHGEGCKYAKAAAARDMERGGRKAERTERGNG